MRTIIIIFLAFIGLTFTGCLKNDVKDDFIVTSIIGEPKLMGKWEATSTLLFDEVEYYTLILSQENKDPNSNKLYVGGTLKIHSYADSKEFVIYGTLENYDLELGYNGYLIFSGKLNSSLNQLTGRLDIDSYYKTLTFKKK